MRWPDAGPEIIKVEPTRFEDMRRGCWDIDARIADMDINGVWASLNFPSMITGFCGRVFSAARDPELGLAVTQAWNDWLYEAWWQPYPDRIIPCGITFLADPELGAAEIRRNAARGFRSVTLPERPHRIDLPSLFSGYWDPIIAACEETDTVISLHVGSSGMADLSPPTARWSRSVATLFGQMSLSACAEWVWSGPAGALQQHQDRHERRRDRLGGDAARPSRQHRRPLGLRPGLRRLGTPPGRGPGAELLVLHHRRPVDHRHPPPDRHRPRHGRSRLPARRLDVARHPGGHPSGTGATSRWRTCAR